MITQIAHYEILEQLGKGGQATAYKAHDSKLDRIVVLKLLSEELAKEEITRKRFMREARLASSLDHPNICLIYDINEVDGHFYIVMQYVPGEPLKNLISRRRLSVDMTMAIAVQIADGLAAAHRQGIVHRDIKSANIMISKAGRAVILDFGLAKRVETKYANTSKRVTYSKLTMAGRQLGTSVYMSPEQVRGLEISPSTDVFSFGILLYEMLAGHRPFRGKNTVDTMYEILNTEPDPIEKIVPNLDPEIARIVHRTLRKRPEDRYGSATELEEDLMRAAAKIGLGSKPLRLRTASGKLGRQFVSSAIDLVQSAAQVMKTFVASPAVPSMPAVASTGFETYESTQNRQLDRMKLAVLPLTNINRAMEQEHFGVGLADTLITELALVGDLIVRPTRAVIKYENRETDPLVVGRELEVDLLLDGAYQVVGDRLRVTMRLFDVHSSVDLWVEKFDNVMTDYFSLQDQIAQRVMRELRVNLSRFEKQRLLARPQQASAFEYYMRAKRLFEKINGPRESEAVIALYQQALALDPRFAPAYAGLAKSYFMFYIAFDNNSTWLDLATQAAKEAINLSPAFTETYGIYAGIQIESGRKMEAYTQLKKVLETSPNDPEALMSMGWFYRWCGMNEMASKYYRAAIKSDPGAWRAYWGLANCFFYQRRIDESERLVERFLTKVDPQNAVLQFVRGEILFFKGEFDHVRELAERLNNTAPELSFQHVLLSKLYAAEGKQEAATEELAKFKRFGAPRGDLAYWNAQIYGLLNKRDIAFEWLRQAIACGNENYPWFERDITLQSLRGNERYINLMRDLKARWERYQREF